MLLILPVSSVILQNYNQLKRLSGVFFYLKSFFYHPLSPPSASLRDPGGGNEFLLSDTFERLIHCFLVFHFGEETYNYGKDYGDRESQNHGIY